MSKTLEDQTIALAGIFQAVALVERLAKTGYMSTDLLEVSMASLFNQNPSSTLDVYGNRIENLQLGLQVMSGLFHQKQSRDYPDTLRYVLDILYLQKKLLSRNDMLQVIDKRLQQGKQQAEHFSLTHENVIANVAAIYSDTLSTFKYRIQVKGDYSYLQQTRIANQVRALLLTAVRSAILWRQVGGTRFQVIFKRKQLSQCADQLLREAKHSSQ